MIHTSITRNCVVFLLPRRRTRSAIYGSQIFVKIRKVKGKPRNFEANVCGSLYSTFEHLPKHMHFITNGYKRFPKKQLNRSKATCSFSALHIWQHRLYTPQGAVIV